MSNVSCRCVQLKIMAVFKGSQGMLPRERCDFMSSQQYNNNVISSLFIMLCDQYFNNFTQVKDLVLITETFVV